MTQIVLIKDDGYLVNLSEKVYKIFTDIGNWPYEWEEYLDHDISMAIMEIGDLLGLEGYSEKAAKALEEQRRRVEIVAERERRLEAREEERRAFEARRAAQWPAVSARLHEISAALLERHNEKGDPPTRNVTPGLWDGVQLR